MRFLWNLISFFAPSIYKRLEVNDGRSFGLKRGSYFHTQSLYSR
uniref:Uncharacterized protein n=1 Tax=Aegilops tauschii subsp. strangulata TaxID=200361 RepID=A0A453J3A3_AEGTS